MNKRKFSTTVGGAAGYDGKRTSTPGTVANSSSKAKTTPGFHYGNSDQQQSGFRYPPWENDSYAYRAHSARPLSGQNIPENFHEYHFRSAYVGSSSSSYRSASTGAFGSSRYALNNGEFGMTDDAGSTRNWEHTGLGSMLNTKKNDPTLMGGGVRFTIMCYNILAPGLLEKHPEVYKKCSSEHLNWDYRRLLLFQEIDTYSPDIVCLQEVENDQYERTFEPRFRQLGFRGVFKKKTGDKEDGCAIFYRTSKFLLIEKLEVELLQPHVPLLNRDNVGLLLKLETRNVVRRQKIVVGTTHLLFNPKRQEVKMAQAQLLLAELDRFAFCGFDRDGKSQYHPILMTGDLNCNPYSNVTKLFTEGRLKYLDENGDLIKLLRRKRINSLLPRNSGVSDQCQHYKIVLERYKRWRAQRVNNFEMDLKSQESLVNLYPYLEARGYFGSATDSDNYFASPPEPNYVLSPPDELVSLLSPASEGMDMDAASVPSVQDIGTGVDDNNLLVEAAEKAAALQVTFAGANVDASYSPSREQLDFPEHQRQAHLERKIIDELNECGLPCDFATGMLTHNFNFRDIYSGRLDRQGRDNESVVTTKQNGWTCVDYIYQSMTWHSTFNKMVEGKLKLIRRLGLFTRSDCKKKGDIPNDQHPSDHFPLVAEFLLRH